MRNPSYVLKSLEENAITPGYRYERLYRNLYNPEFYLLAYKNIAASPGSMTSGADGISLDDMSMARIQSIIASLKDHSYQPNPARRIYIAKKNSSKKRPLGIPSTNDKLVQEIVRMILEAIYEPTFSKKSHGFRPNRSCHTALEDIQVHFKGVKWVVEGDIEACFDSFDHHVLIDLLRKRIQDEQFIALMWKFLRAGYMEQWSYHHTYSGTPQGSGMSPILANIYLSELDTFLESYTQQFDTPQQPRTTSEAHGKAQYQYKKAACALKANRSKVRLYVPHEKWRNKLLEYKAFKIYLDENGKEQWKSIHRGFLVNKTDVEIVSKYNAEIRGLYNYYRLAVNVSVLNNFYFITKGSMIRTFSCKYKTSFKRIEKRLTKDGVFGVQYTAKSGIKRCEFYHDGFTMQRADNDVGIDTLPQYRKYDKPNSLARRLRAGVCEKCQARVDEIHMHHVRKLKDLTGANEFEALMLSRRRKSLALCKACFEELKRISPK